MPPTADLLDERAGRPVLLIDDDPSWAEATSELLLEEGFSVYWVKSGEAGLLGAEQLHPLLVILDVQLPNFDGLEVLHELRRTGSRVPVLMVSAEDRAAVLARALADGAAGFLQKPVAPGLLLRTIRRLAGLAGP